MQTRLQQRKSRRFLQVAGVAHATVSRIHVRAHRGTGVVKTCGRIAAHGQEGKIVRQSMPGVFDRERRKIYENFRKASGDNDLPRRTQLEQIARVTLVQRYLDQLNAILRRQEQVNGQALERHFSRELLLPYTLLDGLNDDETALALGISARTVHRDWDAGRAWLAENLEATG